MTKKNYLKILALAVAVSAPSAIARPGSAGEYLAGDFHQHSLYTDGRYPFMQVMDENANYGLDWWANSEHGGERNRDGEGNNWDDVNIYPDNPILGDYEESGGHQEMWRWQSLRDFVYPDIEATRADYPEKIVINGVEQNVPGHEHCSTAIHQFDGSATAISEFEYRFDRSDDDTSRNGEEGLLNGFGALEKTNNTKDDAILGVKWMQALKDQGVADAWVVPAHVERAWSYKIEDFRNWMDAGPDVAIGFEGIPGHQTSGDRGFGRTSLGGGTYGGAGFYVATVGGLWDALSAEGRKYFNFSSSDFHNHWSTVGSDFWPGEYQKTYTYIKSRARDQIKAVFEGNRSGNSWNVQGDLIDELQFTAEAHCKRKCRRGKKVATMGQTLKVKAGQRVEIKITVHDPVGKNFSPFAMLNPSLQQVGIEQPLNAPQLDHIDLIAGTITGNVPATNPDDVVATKYGTDAAVLKTFERREAYPQRCKSKPENKGNAWYAGRSWDKDNRKGKGFGGKHRGCMTYVYSVRVNESMFLRLRGTNLPANVPFETDAYGNPLADTEANDNIYSLMDADELEKQLMDDVVISTNSKLDEVVEAYADLWFYSNPIYIEVE